MVRDMQKYNDAIGKILCDVRDDCRQEYLAQARRELNEARRLKQAADAEWECAEHTLREFGHMTNMTPQSFTWVYREWLQKTNRKGERNDDWLVDAGVSRDQIMSLVLPLYDLMGYAVSGLSDTILREHGWQEMTGLGIKGGGEEAQMQLEMELDLSSSRKKDREMSM